MFTLFFSLFKLSGVRVNFYTSRLIFLRNLDHIRCWSHNIFAAVGVRLEKFLIDPRAEHMTVIIGSSFTVTHFHLSDEEYKFILTPKCKIVHCLDPKHISVICWTPYIYIRISLLAGIETDN